MTENCGKEDVSMWNPGVSHVRTPWKEVTNTSNIKRCPNIQIHNVYPHINYPGNDI